MSGSFNPVNLVSQVALGVATGGASIWAQLALRVASAIGQQVIQQVGEQLGLPQSAIDMAQGAFAGAVGDQAGVQQNLDEAIQAFGDASGASPADIGDAARVAQDVSDNIVNTLMDGARNARGENAEALRGARGGSLLMKIAIALGQLMDQKMSEMDDLTTQIGGLGTIDNKNQSKMGELTGKLQGLSQEVNMLSNALTNSVKTIGEAGTTLARKG